MKDQRICNIDNSMIGKIHISPNFILKRISNDKSIKQKEQKGRKNQYKTKIKISKNPSQEKLIKNEDTIQ